MITSPNLEDYHILHFPPFSQTAKDVSSGPLACGSDFAMSLSSNSSKIEPTTRLTSRILIYSFKCCSSSKSLCMSILLVSPSTMDINMSLHSFCNCSSCRTSFKACSHHANCALTSASCCANAAQFFCSSLYNLWICTSLFLSTLNSSSMRVFSRTHTPCSRSNF